MSGLDVVTLDEAKGHLRVTHDSEDQMIALYIEAAFNEVENYINGDVPGTGESPEEEVPAAIRAAILLIVGDLFENRDGQSGEKGFFENPAVTRLLYPYRDPVAV